MMATERKTVAVLYGSGDSQVFTCDSFDVVKKDGVIEEVTAVMASPRMVTSLVDGEFPREAVRVCRAGVDAIESVWEVDET